MRFEPGRVAVVTGGASGIGFALAGAAGDEGLHVVLVDLREDALADAAAQLRRAGGEVTTVVADVSSAESVERVASIAFALGPVQLVCSNAGIVRHGRAWEISAADWARAIDVNFMATVHLVRAFLPRLIDAGDAAHLLVTGSMASVTARPGISPYVAAKHALLGLCESLHYELVAVHAPVGVTLLMPGKVLTAMSSTQLSESIQPADVARIAFEAVSRGQLLAFTHPERIAGVEQRFAAIVAQQTPWLLAP